MDLFVQKDFKGNSGIELDFKIECDALSDKSIETIACRINKYCEENDIKFSDVSGVPRGGIRLENALKKYVDENGDYVLIVDDVLTTGGSMEKHKTKIKKETDKSILGFVVFDRGDYIVPARSWTEPVFTMEI
jgi:hypoxanthine phosphoribosyltransferase